MRFLALASLLSLAALPARADDGDFAAAARDGAFAKQAAATKQKWSGDAQEAGARAGGAAPADAPTASVTAQTPDQVLNNWAHRCPAIAAFRASRGAPSIKRGIGISYHVSNGGEIIGNLRSSWYYTWGTKPAQGAVASAKFFPMIYGIGNGTSDVENNLREVDEVRPLPEFLLAYNEPDGNQHIAADDKTWVKSYAPRLPPGVIPVSPATSYANNDWFRAFMKSDGAAAFQHVAVHLYPNITSDDPNSVDNAVKTFENGITGAEKYGKPIWVTEFGLATWKATKENPAKFTDEQAACFMAQVVPFLEKHAERYAWFSPGPDGKNPLYPTLPDALWNLDGSLTPLGELYRQ